MGSVLDLIQSAIIAAIIALMVVGVHFMTMRSNTENRIVQEMQGMADGTVAIIQEEMRFLQSFCSDSVSVSSNSLYFRNKFDVIVFIELHNDSLTVSHYETNESNVIRDGIINEFTSDNSLKTSGGETIPKGYIIDLSSTLTGEQGQTKIIERYNINGDVTIKGQWDMMPAVMPFYKVYEANLIDHRSYNLHLMDKTAKGRLAFTMIKVNPDGSEAVINESSVWSKHIDIVRVDISIKSDPDRLYDSPEDHLIVNLQKDFFLRGHRLFSSEDL